MKNRKKRCVNPSPISNSSPILCPVLIFHFPVILLVTRLVLVTSNLMLYYSVLLTRIKRILFLQVLLEVENFAMEFFPGTNVVRFLFQVKTFLHF